MLGYNNIQKYNGLNNIKLYILLIKQSTKGRSGSQEFISFVVLKVFSSPAWPDRIQTVGEGEGKGKGVFLSKAWPRSYKHVFQSHCFGQNLVTWPCRAIKEARKYSLQLDKMYSVEIFITVEKKNQ